MSYNIHHGVNLAGVNTLVEIGDLINDLAIDFALLQEIDYANDRSQGIDQLQSLSTISKLNFSVPAKVFSYKNGFYGTGILSSYEITKSTIHLVPVLGQGAMTDTIGKSHQPEQRAIHSVDVKIPTGNLRLLNSHFSMWKEERDFAFNQLATFFSEDIPTILGADFNTLDEDEYKLIAKYKNTYLPTFVNPTPSQAIDRLYSNKVIINDIYTLPVTFSDHLPIIMEFDFE